MPTYKYRCESCKHEFETFQSMLDDPITECTKCVKGKVIRLIQPVGIQFKGSGFYINDKSKVENKSGKSEQ